MQLRALRVELACPSIGGTTLHRWRTLSAWELAAKAPHIVTSLAAEMPEGYEVRDGIALHATARVERGAVVKTPCLIGPEVFVAAGATLRGGVWLGAGCSVGPGCEVKSSVLLPGARLAHFNFVGDSVIGADANFEAGSQVANRRNERPDGGVDVRLEGAWHRLAQTHFGALVGDGARIGANAVLAPGTLLRPEAVVGRLELLDPATAGEDPRLFP